MIGYPIRYDFENIRNQKTNKPSTRYLLVSSETEKEIISGLFAVYKKGILKGKKYVVLEKPNEKQLLKNFSKILLGEKNSHSNEKPAFICGLLNPSSDFPNRFFGNTNKIENFDDNNAILLECSEKSDKLTIYIYKGLGQMDSHLFNLWNLGKLSLVSKENVKEIKNAGSLSD